MEVLRAQTPPIPPEANGAGAGIDTTSRSVQLGVTELQPDVRDRPARHRRAAVVDALLALLDVEPEPVDELLREDVHVGARVVDEQRVATAHGSHDERRVSACRSAASNVIGTRTRMSTLMAGPTRRCGT